MSCKGCMCKRVHFSKFHENDGDSQKKISKTLVTFSLSLPFPLKDLQPTRSEMSKTFSHLHPQWDENCRVAPYDQTSSYLVKFFL